MSSKLTRRDLLKALAVAPAVAAGVGSVDGAQRGGGTLQAGETASTKLQVGLVSRHLQWTTVEDGIDLAKSAGFDAIEWNVRDGGHILPERVEQDLPKVIELTHAAGLATPMITTSIQDSSTPYAEAILRTAHNLGVKYYRGGAYFRYDYTKPLVPQIEALKPRIATLVDLNRRYDMVWAYHTHSGLGNIGGNVWDIYRAIKDLDPAFIGLNYDTGHTTIRGGNGWGDAARVAMKYIRCIAVKDPAWERNPAGTWASEFVPVGQGMSNFKEKFDLLKANGFNGPVNIHYDHHDLLGTNVGNWKLEISRAQFLTLIKADLDNLKIAMRAAQVL